MKSLVAKVFNTEMGEMNRYNKKKETCCVVRQFSQKNWRCLSSQFEHSIEVEVKSGFCLYSI
jgi:hypothetical protein